MGRLIFQAMVSLDGFFTGPNGELDWHQVDNEFNEYAIELLHNVEMLVFGRKTYQLMESYWPTTYAMENDPMIASRMNSIPKLVFSTTLQKVEWFNTRLVKDGLYEEIVHLKNLSEKDILVLGSSHLGLTLLHHKLIDEYRIFVSPIILGKGISLFEGIKHRLFLKLVDTRRFQNGNMLLYYV